MIRMTQSQSAQQAKDYYTQNLEQGDYYTSDTEAPGRFGGRLAERLGIYGEVTQEAFFNLIDNRNPVTGERLTPRTTENRRIGYDITFSAIKEASVINALSKDGHVQDDFMAAVRDTMQEIEADIQTRVRVKGADHQRQANGLIWGEFLHHTSRAVDGQLPDPHLHCHVFVMNTTYDEVEGKIKAGDFSEIKRSMNYFQARFNKNFADRLSNRGYTIRKTKNAFTIENLPPGVTDLFSKRTRQIKDIAKQQGITNAKELDALGAKTRSKKIKGLTMADLKKEWRRQIRENIPPKDGEQDFIIRQSPQKQPLTYTAKDAVNFALKNGFERASVKEGRALLTEAYKHSIGNTSIGAAEIDQAFRDEKSIIRVKEKGRMLCTTKEVLTEEKELVAMARSGKGKFAPIYDKAPMLQAKGQHARAISHVLTTKDQVSIIMGSAGAGKTTLLKELVPIIERTGKPVTIVAPSAQASRGVLKSEGFDQADTVSRLLVDKKQQEALKNGVLIVDEAGLLSVKQATDLLKLAKEQNAQLLYCGDTRQHNAVERGDALRVINKIGGIRAAEVNQIHRQRDLFYREAVQDLAKGDVGNAFTKLDEIGAIKEIDPLNPNEALVNDYIDTISSGKRTTALIVAPTHAQGRAVTAKVRGRLRDIGRIGKKEIGVTRYSNTNMTEAERGDWRNFAEGQAVQFNQNVPGIKNGSMWSVDKATDNAVYLIDKAGETKKLPLDRARHFNVYERSEIGLSKGDQVKVTHNSKDKAGKDLDNGTSFRVDGVNKAGKIVLVNPVSKRKFTIDRDFGHIDHDYCTTSHSSQGKTTDHIFISQPASTFGATSAKQLYVSVSRGRDSVRLYTDDKNELLKRAMETGDRQSAIELTGHLNNVIMQERTKTPVQQPGRQPGQQIEQTLNRQRSYEPEF